MNQITAVEWFQNIVEAHSEDKKNELIKMLHDLPDQFKTELNRKIKDKNHLQQPEYKLESSTTSNTRTSTDFEKFVEESKKIREEGQLEAKARKPKYYSEFPEINLAVEKMEYSEQNIKTGASFLFPILKLCLLIETIKENELSNLDKQLSEDNMLKQFKNDKKEYFESYVEKQFPNIGFGSFCKLFNKTIEEKSTKRMSLE